jgi:REase_AHJR-like
MISSQSTLEREALDELERRLADQGYILQREPRGAALPEFLGKFEPDAIAIGKKPNLLIEVITQRGTGDVETTKVRQLQQLLDGHPDWKLEILYTAPSSPLPAVASVEAIRRRLGEVKQLADTDGPAALVLAWSLLEAVARRVLPDRASRALTPATTVELLTSLGYIVQSEADSLRATARSRNLIVHGDVEQDAPRAQLATVLEIIDALLGHLERQTSGAA